MVAADSARRVRELETAEPSESALYAFTAENVTAAPSGPGVYTLLRHNDVVMIGATTHLRDDLIAHQRGDRGVRTRCASRYRVEATTLARMTVRGDEVMDEYRKTHNSNVPRGNRPTTLMHKVP
jgi:hypothetical protein